MITRSRAKMATNNNNSESQEFDINNELNIEGKEIDVYKRQIYDDIFMRLYCIN